MCRSCQIYTDIYQYNVERLSGMICTPRALISSDLKGRNAKCAVHVFRSGQMCCELCSVTRSGEKKRSHTRSLYLRYCRSGASSLYRCKDVLEAMLELSELWWKRTATLPNCEGVDGGKEARSTRDQRLPRSFHIQASARNSGTCT